MVSYLDVATIESTSHLDGRLFLVNRDGLCIFLDEGREVFLVPPRTDTLRVAHIESSDLESDAKAVVRFAEVGSIDDAEKLIGMHCLISKDDIDEELLIANQASNGEFADWTFTDETSGRSGTILRSWSNAGNLLGEVVLDDGDKSMKIIPLAKDLISDFDEGEKTLSMLLPRGIFDL